MLGTARLQLLHIILYCVYVMHKVNNPQILLRKPQIHALHNCLRSLHATLDDYKAGNKL